MKKLSLATALITSLFAMGANAYQYEVNVGYENTDIESSLHDEQSDLPLTLPFKQKNYFSPKRKKSIRKAVTPNSHKKVMGKFRRYSPHATPPRKPKNRRSKRGNDRF